MQYSFSMAASSIEKYNLFSSPAVEDPAVFVAGAGEGWSRSALHKSENAGCRKAAGKGGHNLNTRTPLTCILSPVGRGKHEGLLY